MHQIWIQLVIVEMELVLIREFPTGALYSPDINVIHSAYFIHSSGDGFHSYYVEDSYGYFSPGTNWGDIACYLGPNGNIFEDINFYVDSVKDSYG